MGIGGANSSEFACGVARSGSPQGVAQPRLRVKQRLLRVEALTGAGEKKLMSDYWGSMIKEGKDPKLESYS